MLLSGLMVLFLRDELKSAFDDSTEVDVMDSSDAENLAVIERPELGVTFTVSKTNRQMHPLK